MRRLFIGLILTGIAVIGVSAFQHASGEISGIVVDDHGVPVVGARVIALSASGNPYVVIPHVGVIPHAETDNSGTFVLKNLAFDVYSVHAMKESEGHPKTYWSFYSQSFVAPRVQLSLVQLQA